MIPGAMDTADGIDYFYQLTLTDKTDVTIMCANQEDADSCIWKGASQKMVVYFNSNGGTTTLGFVTIRDGDYSNVSSFCSRA